jgi:hypothetical protein
MKTFECSHCGQLVFFENVRCEACEHALGYIPELKQMLAFEIDEGLAWHALGNDTAKLYRPCRNYTDHAICNWMVNTEDAHPLCHSCRYTEVIPQLATAENRQYWFALEAAKRSLIYTLDELGLAIPGKQDNAAYGLAFHFLEETAALEPVITGHDDGLITLNIAEADDVAREAQRTAMGEPYRTLLGHFRHEIGHFYWQWLIADGPWLDGFRALFGDERIDYAAAMQAHYQSASAANWHQQHISAYAAMHPWEDWAETWAHYLHIMDAMKTAHHWGVSIRIRNTPSATAAVKNPHTTAMTFCDMLVEHWLPLTQFLNSMNRSLGQHDGYPFVIENAVIAKLDFVHQVVQAASGLAWTDLPPPLAAGSVQNATEK